MFTNQGVNNTLRLLVVYFQRGRKCQYKLYLKDLKFNLSNYITIACEVKVNSHFSEMLCTIQDASL